MLTRTAASVGLLALSLGALCGQDKDGAPGNPPTALIAAGIDKDGTLLLVQYKTIYLQPTAQGGGGPIYNERSLSKAALKGVKIYGREGKELTVEAARESLGSKETPILVSSWGEKLPPFYRTVFKDDVLLFAFPQQAPTWKPIQEPEVPVRK
ncbi:hypothetical protein [Zavarzinella formosa]|uniref:hypothetical protein n=1 Tax=Zavarzinella formosa TaxID=360055 RepID=UPI0002D93174|nr:hypothetical protein [Zavarzinella formosa]